MTRRHPPPLALMPAVSSKASGLLPLCTMYVGPGMLLKGWVDACPAATYYMRRKIGPPGGALCINASSLANCRGKVWRE